MGNVTGVLLWRKPLSEERAVFQEWKNASESLRVSQAVLHFLFSYLSGIKDGDGQAVESLTLVFWLLGFFQTSAVESQKKTPTTFDSSQSAAQCWSGIDFWWLVTESHAPHTHLLSEPSHFRCPRTTILLSGFVSWRFRQLNQLTAASRRSCALPPWAQSLACLSSCFICLQNRLFGEAQNVASLDLYANHIYPNKASKISLMFTAAKSHFSLIYATVYTWRHHFIHNLL